ncbi:hypothetical protein LZ31DRAFT_137726 [Colletotrichum somersetense]|nr:hypothetical protein LZ31DRAFT_137726 [Colletotrichum somersetense]
MNSPEVQRICWPNLEWKELGWNCRQSRIFPRNLCKYKLAALFIGTNAARPNAVYQRIKSHRSVILDCFPKVDSFNPNFSAAVQYVFSPKGEYFLGEHVGNNIRITSLVRSDLEDWVNDFRSLLR